MKSRLPRTHYQRAQHVRLVIALCLATGCRAMAPSSTAADIAGVYVLERYNGQPVPAPTTSASCGPVVTDGTLALTPRRYETRLFYTLDVIGRPSCDTTTVSDAYVLKDAGYWDDTSPRPQLNGGGAAGELGGREVVVVVSGREYTYRFARRVGVTLHSISMSALEGARVVDGAFFELTQADGVVSRSGTSFGQPHRTGVVAGALRVRAIPSRPLAGASLLGRRIPGHTPWSPACRWTSPCKWSVCHSNAGSGRSAGARCNRKGEAVACAPSPSSVSCALGLSGCSQAHNSFER